MLVRRHPQRARRLCLGVLAALLALVAVAIEGGTPAGAASLGQLDSQLAQEQQRQHDISAGLAQLQATIATLEAQISLVEGREAGVRGQLAADRQNLAASRRALAAEQRRVAALRARLALARRLLARQLVAGYESSPPDLMTVLIQARGFNQLLEQVNFLQRAETQQQAVIALTRRARTQAVAEERRLGQLTVREVALTDGAQAEARALAVMGTLLQSRRSILARAQAIQQAALSGSRARAGALQSAISTLQAQQAAEAAAAEARARAAAAAAAAAAASPASSASSAPVSTAGGFSIPSSVVSCESGGQNLPPNGAGASGYYQILPSTWKLYGGTGSAAYLASKAEQDAVASRIWNGGSGASQWVCAGIVGIR